MATERICAVCKSDCSTSERLKDKKGRYFHKGCYERARNAALAKQKRANATPKAAPKARPPAAARVNPSCANCNAMLAPGAVLCTTCGYNAQTGEMMQMLSAVKFDNTPEKRSSGGPKIALPKGSFSTIVANPLIIAAIVGAVFGVLLLMGRSSPGAAFVCLIGMFIMSFAVGIWLIVDAFSESATHGILCLLCGPYSLYYLFSVSNNQNLKIAYGLNLLLFVGWFGLASSIENDPTYFDEAGLVDDSFEMDQQGGFDVDDEFEDDESMGDASNALEGNG